MRKISSLICVFVLVFGLIACSGDGQSNANANDTVHDNVTEINESVVDQTEKAEVKAHEEKNMLDNPNAELLNKGDTVAVGDVCEITLDYIDITSDVKPKSPASYYSHYEADDGKVYVDVCVAYKNTDTAAIEANDTMSGRLVYAGKYEYFGFSMIEENNRSDFTYADIVDIAPLSTEYMHYLFEVPEEVKNSGKEVLVYLTVADKDLKVLVTQGSVDNSETVSVKEKADVGGIVKDGEAITTSNAEFFVDYSNITNDVKPKSPANFYTHYVADSGKVYVDFCIAYKNTSGSDIGADKVMSASLKYADKYDYNGFSMIEEDNRGDFNYSNITSIAPLTTEYVHYLFEVPDEVKNSSESVVIYFNVDGSEFEYAVR